MRNPERYTSLNVALDSDHANRHITANVDGTISLAMFANDTSAVITWPNAQCAALDAAELLAVIADHLRTITRESNK